MNSPLATQAEVQSVRTGLDTLSREVNNYRRESKDREERWLIKLAEEQAARAEDRKEFDLRLNRRTRLEVAILGSATTILVVLLNAFSSHSYARAMLQVDEKTRHDRELELEQLKAHDELLIKKTSDDIERRIQALGFVVQRSTKP